MLSIEPVKTQTRMSQLVGVKTRYMLFNVNPKTGKETQLTGWSNNTLLTSGRNALASQNWVYAVQLGTDGTDPAAGQTALLGYVAGTSSVVSGGTTYGAASSAPWYGWKQIRFRFTPGQAVGTLSEVGLGWSAASGSNLAFRALLVDITGTQVTVVPLADEYVDVVVEIRCYPPLDDVTGTVDFAGETYNYILRASEVGSASWWGQYIGTPIGKVDTFTSYWQAYNGDIRTIDLAPNGTNFPADGTNAYNEAYSNNSYERHMAQIGGPNAWNATTGSLLRSFRFITTLGAYQIQFDRQSSPGTGIPKTNAYNIKFSFILGWAEAGPIFTGPIATQNWSNGVPASLDISTNFQPYLPEPITYTLVSGSIPSGMSLNASTGLLDGTPDTVSSGSLEIQCENDVGSDSTNIFSWSVT